MAIAQIARERAVCGRGVLVTERLVTRRLVTRELPVSAFGRRTVRHLFVREWFSCEWSLATRGKKRGTTGWFMRIPPRSGPSPRAGAP